MEWGATSGDVLDFYRAAYLADFRNEISGTRDTIQIDELRRRQNQRFSRVQNSYEEFSGTRTGYEVSVLGDEVAAGNEESMLTVRTENATLYYVFASDQLFKIVVAYNSSYLGGLQFEAFLDQVERRYGPPAETEVDETVGQMRYLARALWTEDDTRLRVENRSNLFGTYIMVFSDGPLEDRVLQLRGAATASNSNQAVNDLIQSISDGRNNRLDNSN
ncbi:MAG: hypothetical protein KC561_21605, partial [Myxococcales bacterium]|nr:hypothetical protein [Myxococcales bacterium]